MACYALPSNALLTKFADLRESSAYLGADPVMVLPDSQPVPTRDRPAGTPHGRLCRTRSVRIIDLATMQRPPLRPLPWRTQ